MSPSAVLFGLVCGVGSVVALTLTVQQARHVDPLESRVVSTTRTGDVITVVAEVHNTTSVPRCAKVQLAARDREGRDLARETAAARAVLAAGERLRVTGQLTVSERAYSERLQGYDAYTSPCPVTVQERTEQK